MCFYFECDVERLESKICWHAKGNQNTSCRLPCMSSAILRNVVVTIGSMYLIASLLPVSYYILHTIIPKVLLTDPAKDLRDIQQLSTLSVGMISALLVNLFFNVGFLIGVEIKLKRQIFLVMWMITSIFCIVFHGIACIYLTYVGMGSSASNILEKRKIEKETQGNKYFPTVYHLIVILINILHYKHSYIYIIIHRWKILACVP